MKKCLLTLLISTVIFIALLFGVEFILGVISDQAPKEFVPQRHVYLKENTPGTSRTHDQPLTYFTSKAIDGPSRTVRFEVDEKGYIEPSNVLDHADASIVFMGGSTTECWAVAEEKRFPYLVGHTLRENGFRVNTLNAAVAGNTSAHTLNIYLNKVLVEEPDIAVMMHNINDLHELIRSRYYWKTNGRPSHIITQQHSFTTAFAIKAKSVFPNIGMRFDNVIGNFRKKSTPVARKIPRLAEEDKSVILKKFKENLRLFVSISRIKGVTPVLMTQGNRIKGDFLGVDNDLSIIPNRFNMSFEEYKRLYFKMNQAIREVCEQEEVLMIDLDALVLPEHIFDSVHYNDNGSVFVADKVVEHLTPLVEQITTE